MRVSDQNNLLVEQIRNFEKESFEIQTKVKRGLEYEGENKMHGQAIGALKDRERELQR